jgi:hypothetical protein
LLAVLFLALLTILTIDGRAYERWKSANVLRTQHHAWIKEGAPWPPPNPTNYVRASWGTSYLYNASHIVDGERCQGLYAFRAHDWPHHYAITTNGVVLVLGEKNGIRLLRFTKEKAAAW